MHQTFAEWFSLYFKKSSWLKKRRQAVAKKFEDVHPEFLFAVDLCYHLLWGMTIIDLPFFLRYFILEVPYIATTNVLKVIIILIDIPISFFAARVIGVAVAALMFKIRYRKH